MTEKSVNEVGLSKNLDTLTKEELLESPLSIDDYPYEKQIELIKKYELDVDSEHGDFFQKTKEICEEKISQELEEKNSLIKNPSSIINYPVEKQNRLIEKYKLDEVDDFFKTTLETNNENNLPVEKYSNIKNEFLKIVNEDNIPEKIEKLKKRITNKDDEYVSILTECSLTGDTGYKKLDKESRINFTYFLTIESARKYVFDYGYIQLYGKSGIYNIYTKKLEDYRSSKNLLSRIKVLKIRTKKEEIWSFEGLDKVFFKDELNRKYCLTWNPNKDKMFTENRVDYFNEYNPIQYQGINHGKDLSLIYYHIKHYLCSDNEEVYNYFISVISDMIRNPGRKLPICIVMNGEGGIGKSFLFDKLFRKLFGDMYGFGSNKISGRFNKELENKICFLIEELSHQDNKNESNIIKDMISNPKIRIERKGIDSYEVENCIRFFICSNGEWSVRIENNNSSRRYLVCDVSNDVPDYEHFNKLSELIKGDKRKGYEDEKVLTETIEQFSFDMGKIDLSVLETNPPETEGKKISQSYSKGIPEKQLEEFFKKVICNDGLYYWDVDPIKILDETDENEIKSTLFWDCFTEYLKDRRQQIPEGFSNYGRILSKWFGKEYSRLDTKVINGKRNRILTFPKIDVVEGIIEFI